MHSVTEFRIQQHIQVAVTCDWPLSANQQCIYCRPKDMLAPRTMAPDAAPAVPAIAALHLIGYAVHACWWPLMGCELFLPDAVFVMLSYIS